MEKKERKKILLIYGTTNKHLGLWNDLINDSRVILRSTERRIWGTSKFVRRVFGLALRILGQGKHKHLLFEYHDLFSKVKEIEHLILIDGALNNLNISELKMCRKLNNNLKISLYILNSMDAQSPLMIDVRPKIREFDWDNIFTTDPGDSEKYNFNYLSFKYYSAHSIPLSPYSEKSDVFFVGGLKGGRTDTIYKLYKYLVDNKVKCDFYLMPMNNINKEYLPGIYYYHGWRPYEEILQHVHQTKCIIEIIQGGQTGPTLRYVEAVCMNKKLLTNNPNITKFPFYNPKWMKIFSTVEDVDVEWISNEDSIEYNYNNEFSPVHLIDYLLKKDEEV